MAANPPHVPEEEAQLLLTHPEFKMQLTPVGARAHNPPPEQ
jgi:hypothetical protein